MYLYIYIYVYIRTYIHTYSTCVFCNNMFITQKTYPEFTVNMSDRSICFSESQARQSMTAPNEAPPTASVQEQME